MQVRIRIIVLAGIIAGWFLLSVGCQSVRIVTTEMALKRFEYNQPQMGVNFRLVLYAPDEATALEAGRAAYARIRQLNDILSDYDPETELSRLSQSSGQGKTVQVSPELWLILERSQHLARHTQGAFDITVGPYVKAWREARREKRLPESLATLRGSVGYQKLELNAALRSARLLAPNMRLDVGGIAKGYAADEALKVLRAHGINRALVCGGGDTAFGDAPPGRTGWRIEIAPLDVPDTPPPRFALLSNCALAISGDFFQHVEIEGKRYSHIVDPHTGIGLTDQSLVTVIAPDGITADGLSTAVSVLGPVRGVELIEESPGAAACIARAPGGHFEHIDSRRLKRFLVPP